MKSYAKTHVKEGNRTELHDVLSLTGAEVSVNTLLAGTGVPFVHSHKQNEEIISILSGKGRVIIDGESIELSAGDWIRISPKGQRQFFASEDEAMTFVCIQVKENSLEVYTREDGIIHE